MGRARAAAGGAASAVRRRPVPALALLGLTGWLLLPATADVDAAVSGAAWTVTAGVAAVRCAVAARRGGPAAAAWRLLALASGAWAVGAAWWAVLHAAAGGAPPFPSPADVGLLAFPVLAVAGLLRFPGLPLSATSRLRLLLDAAVATTSLLVLAVLAGMSQLHTEGPADVAGRLAFLFTDVLAASVAMLVLDRVRRGALPAVRRAAWAVVVVVSADLVYSAVSSSTGYEAGGVLDAVWCAAFLLLASAADVRRRAIDDPRPGNRLLPPVAAISAGAALLASGRLVTGMDVVLAGAVVALGAALTGRQVLLARENAELNRSLEDKVADRTDQLRTALDDADRRARTDGLTGLANREGFAEHLAAALDAGGRTAVVLLDLDRFQEVNDGLGHDVGDTVLRAAARRLAGGLRDGQVLARFGGDEFAVLLTGMPEEDAVGVGDRLVRLLATPLAEDGLEVLVGASAGVAVHDAATAPAGSHAVRDVLRDADTALHAAKADGGSAVRVFRREMHDTVRRSIELQRDLRTALAERRLSVHYQPVVDLVADRVVGVEALARWTHPVHGPVPPLQFIAAAERSGLVVPLERLVLELACGQLARWRRARPSLTVAVNVSARHLREADYLKTVLTTLGRHGLPPSALVLEVTESLLFHDDDSVREVLEGLHTAGVALALDDFGTGYSSLSRLAGYPFDTLKVDRSFVTGLDEPRGAALLTATLAMARGLGMRVVAEGVETAEQLRFLSRSGCELAQGYLLSRPGPAETVGPVLDRRLLPTPREGDRRVVR